MTTMRQGSAPVSIEANFGNEPPFSVGVEEELLLVDERFRLVDEAEEARRAVDPPRGDVAGELFAAMIEAKSPVSSTVADAIAALRDVRRRLAAEGERAIGVGVHPSAPAGTAAIHRTGRYALIEASLQGLLRTPLCGQHIHVGIPDAETAVRAHNGIRAHVPLLNALAANSPFWFGEDSGLASSRTVLFRSYPRAAMTPELESFSHFERIVEEICRVGRLEDYTHIWWDVRLHPALGTLEVRAADTQFDIRRTAALTALVHCLVRIEAERSQEGLPSREALAEASFQATRHGLDARLMARDGTVLPARELARRTLAEAGGAATELGCESELAEVERILAEGCGADIQRRVHRERGMDGLLRYLTVETARVG